jgi:hypothetical protein
LEKRGAYAATLNIRMYEELIEPVLFMGDGKEAHNATIMLGNGDRPTTRDLGGYARGKVRFGCNGMRQPN